MPDYILGRQDNEDSGEFSYCFSEAMGKPLFRLRDECPMQAMQRVAPLFF